MKFHSLTVRRLKDDEDIPCVLVPEDSSSVGPDSLDGRASIASSDTGSVMAQYAPEELYRFTNQLGRLIQDENHPQPQIILMAGHHSSGHHNNVHKHFQYSNRDHTTGMDHDDHKRVFHTPSQNQHRAVNSSSTPRSTITMNTSNHHHHHSSSSSSPASNIITQVDGQLVILNQNSKTRQAERMVEDLQRRRFFLYWLQVYNSIRFSELLLLRRMVYQWKHYIFTQQKAAADAKELDELSTSSQQQQHRQRSATQPQPTLTYHPVSFAKAVKSSRAIRSTATKESIIERNIKAISKYQHKQPVILKVDKASVLHTKTHNHHMSSSTTHFPPSSAAAPKSPSATTNKRRMDSPSSSFAKPIKRKMLHPTNEYDASIPFAKSSPPCSKFKLPEETKPKRSVTPPSSSTSKVVVEAVPLAVEARRLQQHFNQVLEGEKSKFVRADSMQRLRERMEARDVPLPTAEDNFQEDLRSTVDEEDTSTVQQTLVPTQTIQQQQPVSRLQKVLSNSNLAKQQTFTISTDRVPTTAVNRMAHSDPVPTSIDDFIPQNKQRSSSYVDPDVSSVVTFDDVSTVHEPRATMAVQSSLEFKPSLPLVQTRIAMYEPEPRPQAQLPPQPQRDNRELMFRLRSKFHNIPEQPIPSQSSFRSIAPTPTPEMSILPEMQAPPRRVQASRTPSPAPIIDPPTPLARSRAEPGSITTSPTSPVENSIQQLPVPMPSPARNSLPVEYQSESESRPESLASASSKNRLSKLMNRINRSKSDDGNIVRRSFTSKDAFSSPEHKKRCSEDDDHRIVISSSDSFQVAMLEAHKDGDDEMSSLTKEKSDDRSTSSTISSISQTLAQYRTKRNKGTIANLFPPVVEGEHETSSLHSACNSTVSSAPPPPPSPRSAKHLPIPIMQQPILSLKVSSDTSLTPRSVDSLDQQSKQMSSDSLHARKTAPNLLSSTLSFPTRQNSAYGLKGQTEYTVLDHDFDIHNDAYQEDVSFDQLGEMDRYHREEHVGPRHQLYAEEDVDHDFDDATSALTELTSYNAGTDQTAPEALNMVISPEQYEYQVMLLEMRQQGKLDQDVVLRVPERSRSPALIGAPPNHASEFVNVQSATLALMDTPAQPMTPPRQRVSLRRVFIQLQLNIARSKEHWEQTQHVCTFAKEKSRQRAFHKWLSAVRQHIAYQQQQQNQRHDPKMWPMEVREANQMRCKGFFKRWVLHCYRYTNDKHNASTGKEHFIKLSCSKALQRWIRYKNQNKELKVSTNVKLQRYSSQHSIESIERLSSPRSAPQPPPTQPATTADDQSQHIIVQPKKVVSGLMSRFGELMKQTATTPLPPSSRLDEDASNVSACEESPIMFTSPISMPPSAVKCSPSVHDSDSELAMSSFVSNDLGNISGSTNNNLYLEESFDDDGNFFRSYQPMQETSLLVDVHTNNMSCEQSAILPDTSKTEVIVQSLEDSQGSFVDDEEDNFMFLSDDSTDASSVMHIEELDGRSRVDFSQSGSNWFAIKKLSPSKTLLNSSGSPHRSSAGFESIRNLTDAVNLLIKMFRSRKFNHHKLYAEGMYYLVQFNLKQNIGKQLHNIAEKFHQEQVYRRFMKNLHWLTRARKANNKSNK